MGAFQEAIRRMSCYRITSGRANMAMLNPVTPKLTMSSGVASMKPNSKANGAATNRGMSSMSLSTLFWGEVI